MNPKNNRVPGWLVPYLGKKVRQLRRTETALRQRITELFRENLNQRRELANTRAELAAVAEYYRDYSKKQLDQIIAAHKRIGALEYTLERHGIAAPDIEG